MRYTPLLLSAIVFCAGPLSTLGQTLQRPAKECPRVLAFGEGFLETSDPEQRTGPAGPGRSGGDIDATAIRIDTDLVVAEFDVRDKKGKRISGLGPSDFKLEEDGVEQDIEVFSFGRASARISRSIILLIDYSQSQIPYIETSVEAAKVLVDLLEPNDQMAVVTDDVELAVSFTKDKALLKERLEMLKARSLAGKYGKSRQFSALYAAVNELFAADEKRPVVIFQTDGDEFAPLSMGTSGRANDECSPLIKRFEQLEAVLERAGTTVYSIIPGLRMDERSDEERMEFARLDLETIIRRETKVRKSLMEDKRPFSGRVLRNWARSRLRDAGAVERVSRLTGGMTQYLDSPERAGEVYRRILEEMNQRYLIGYYPVDTTRDGRKRSIRISLRAGSNYSVTGRTSYTPAERSGRQ